MYSAAAANGESRERLKAIPTAVSLRSPSTR